MPLLRNASLLRAFLAVAREGNLSAAARSLSVSQPALTKSIRKLEQQFGVPLFDRRARGMTLTRGGAALLAHAKLIEAQCGFADAEIEMLAHGEGGRIRLGAGTYWGVTVVPRAVATLQARLPRLRVDLEVGVNSVILPKLFAGDLDFVMSALPERSDLPPGIETRSFGELHLRIVAGRDHPLVRRRAVSIDDIARHPFAIYQHDRDVLARLGALNAGRGVMPAISVETTSLHALVQLLKSGPYVACLPDGFLRAMPDPGLAVVPFRRDIWSFDSGALFPAALREAPPIVALLELLGDLTQAAARSTRRARAAA
jgi:DNA-binding transcriptional LysR family regulator